MDTQNNRFLQQIGNAKAKFGDVLAKALFGEEIAQPETTVINNDGVYSIESGVNNGGRKGGLVNFINDARNGMLENSSQGFQAQNLYPDKEKGTGYRLGEVAGSALRLLDNPLARGAIAYGLSKRMGDENPLGEALTAASLTRQNRAKDQMYRKALAERGIDTSGIRGYVGDDMFKSILEDAQLRDNAEYRNAMLQTQVNNQREMMEYRKQEAERKARQDRIDTDIEYKKLGLQEKALEQKGQNDTKDMQTLNEMEAQLNDFVATFDVVDNPYRYRIAGGASQLLNTLTPEEANFEAKRTLLFNAIARKLGEEKGVLSDQDIKRIDNALPKLADNKKQKMAKMDATYSLLNIRRGGGEQQTPQNLNVDHNALEAEMKRRGLK